MREKPSVSIWRTVSIFLNPDVSAVSTRETPTQTVRAVLSTRESPTQTVLMVFLLLFPCTLMLLSPSLSLFLSLFSGRTNQLIPLTIFPSISSLSSFCLAWIRGPIFLHFSLWERERERERRRQLPSWQETGCSHAHTHARRISEWCQSQVFALKERQKERKRQRKRLATSFFLGDTRYTYNWMNEKGKLELLPEN